LGGRILGALCIFDEAWKRLFDSSMLSTEQRGELDRAPARYADVRNRIMPLVAYGANGVPAKIPFHANKVAYYRKVMRDRSRPVEHKIVDVADTLLWAVRWKLHVRSQPALLVSFSGIDGSGKSLQAERLRTVFETCDVRVHSIWARGLSSRAVGSLMRAGKRVLGAGDGAHAAEGAPPARGEAQRF
jgi:hypothetical protein